MLVSGFLLSSWGQFSSSLLHLQFLGRHTKSIVISCRAPLLRHSRVTCLRGAPSATPPVEIIHLSLPETGDYDVVASKAGYKDETQPISITSPGIYTLDFRGEHGLIPQAPSMSYVLGCVNHWLYPVEPCGLSMSKVLAVVNAWLYPT